jgi:beta-lactam-binding protein with PASTA domain
MPNLVGYSFRNAEMVLKNMGLKLGDTIFKPDFARNAVLDQLYNGKTITAGTKIRQGSSVSLVLGNGVGQNEFAVPVIIGMTLGNAKLLLQTNGLNIGAVVPDPDVTDTTNAYIYWQNPPRINADGRLMHIRAGQLMDVRVGVQKPVVDSTQIPSSAPEQ